MFSENEGDNVFLLQVFWHLVLSGNLGGKNPNPIYIFS